MNEFPLWDASLTLRLTMTLLHFVWQGIALAAIAVLAGWLLRGARTKVRYVTYLATLAAMVACLPVTFALVSVPRPDHIVTQAHVTLHEDLAVRNERLTADPTTMSFSNGESTRSPLGSDESLTESLDGLIGTPPSDAQAMTWIERIDVAAPYAVAVYLVGVAFMLIRLSRALRGGQRLRRESTPIADENLLATVRRQAQRLRLRAAPTVAWCERISVPLVVGVVRPMILLPTSLATGLAPTQLESLLTHELAHIRRFDVLVNLLQRFVEAVLFFHPAVWYVSRCVSVEREHACDDAVVSLGWKRVEYADALLRMAELCLRGSATSPSIPLSPHTSSISLSASGENTTQFKRRVLRLLNAPQPPRLCLSRTSVAAIAVALTMLIATPAVIQSWAQPPAEAENQLIDDGTPGDESEATRDDAHETTAEQELRADTRAAIALAVKFLKESQREDGGWPMDVSANQRDGLTALATLALISAGQSEQDVSVQRGLNYLKSVDPSFTYAVALQTLVYCSLDAAKHRDAIEHNVKWLVETQTAEGDSRGGWSYGPARSTRSDGSNTRFAVWALAAARRAGIEIPADTWSNVARYWLESQRPDGSWGYMPSVSNGTSTMTLAGVACLDAVRQATDDANQHDTIEAAIKRAWKWYDQNYAADDGTKQRSSWKMYELHCLLLAARATNHDRIGDVDWFAENTRSLLDSQDAATGRWIGESAEQPLIATSLALLFLNGEDVVVRPATVPKKSDPVQPPMSNDDGAEAPRDDDGALDDAAGKQPLPDSGLIVFAIDGRPAANVEVVGYSRSGKEIQRMRADGEGNFSFPAAWWNDGSGSESDVVLVAGIGDQHLGWFDFQQHAAAARREGEPLRVTITLLPRDTTVSGRLVRPDGKPAEGVCVRARSLNHPANRYASWFANGIDDELPFPSDTTDSEGRFALRVPANSLRQVQVNHTDWVTRTIDVRDGEDAGDIPLKPAGQIAGHVIDAKSGEPVPNATVAARGFASDGKVGGYGYATSDAQGAFQIGGLNPEFYNVQVGQIPDRPALVSPLRDPVAVVAGETTSRDFGLIEGRRIRGRLIEANSGEPIVDGHIVARVTIQPNELSGGVGRVTRSDKQGDFELFVPPGVCHVHADAGARESHPESSRTIDVAAGAEPIQILLKVGPEIERRGFFGSAAATSTDSTTPAGSKPVATPKRPTVTVHLRTDSPQPIGDHIVRLVFKNSNFVAEWSVKSGATFDKEFLEREVGRVASLLINVPGFAPTSTPEFTIGRDMQPIDVDLEPAVEVPVRGRVVGQDGEPVSGARVRVRRIFHGNDTEFPWGVETATDAEGRFELKHLHAGERVTVHVAKEGVAEFETQPFLIAKRDAIDLGQIPLIPANKQVSGRVTDQDGLPVPDAKVVFDGVPKRETQTDAEGRFSLTGLPAGRLELKLSATDGSRTRRSVIAGSADVRLFLPLKSLYDSPEYRLTVTLRTPDGEPPAEARYYLLDLTTKRWRQAGGFNDKLERTIDMHSVLRREPDHRYALMVFADGFATNKPIEIVTQPQIEPLTVDLQPVAMSTLVGRVVDEQGQPIASASVGLSLELTEGLLIEHWKYISNAPEDPPVTDSDGRFRIPGLHEGTRAAVYVNQAGHAGVWSERVTIGNKVETSLPELVLRKSTRAVRGRVVDSEGRVIMGARVWVHDFSQPETKTDAEGRFKLTAVPAGELRMVAAAAGYDSSHKDFTVEEASGELTLTLDRDPAQFLPTSAERAVPESKPAANDKPAPDNKPQPDDQVRQWLGTDGVVVITDQQGRIVEIYLGGNATDETLARIKTLSHLKHLNLELLQQLTEKGMQHLGELRADSIVLYSFPLPPGSLQHLSRVKGLRELSMTECGVEDADLAHLRNLTQLRGLNLDGNRLTDAGLTHLKNLSQLESLSIAHTNWVESKMRITDAGLANLKGLTRLRELDLHGLSIGDAGLAQLADLRELRSLNVSGTQITGEGLRHLVNHPRLESLILGGPWINDAGMQHVAGCANLTHLSLSYTKVGDAGFANIERLANLERLHLDSRFVTSAGLIPLKTLPRMAHLELRASQVFDDGLKHIAGIRSLTRLDLSGSGEPGVNVGRNFTSVGFAYLKDAPNLKTLYLTNSDVPWTALRDLKQLRELSMLMPSSMSSDDIRQLQLALPDTQVSAAWGGTSVRPIQFLDKQIQVIDISDAAKRDPSTSRGDVLHGLELDLRGILRDPAGRPRGYWGIDVPSIEADVPVMRR